MYFGIKHLQTKIQCDKSLTLKFIHEFSCPFYTGNFVILGDLALSMFFLAGGPSNFLAVTIWILGGRFHKIALSKQKSKLRVIIVPNLCITHYFMLSREYKVFQSAKSLQSREMTSTHSTLGTRWFCAFVNVVLVISDLKNPWVTGFDQFYFDF